MTSKEALEKIEYNLEVLEILKEYVYFDEKDNSIKMNQLKECETNYDFEIVKEWLEE